MQILWLLLFSRTHFHFRTGICQAEKKKWIPFRCCCVLSSGAVSNLFDLCVWFDSLSLWWQTIVIGHYIFIRIMCNVWHGLCSFHATPSSYHHFVWLLGLQADWRVKKKSTITIRNSLTKSFLVSTFYLDAGWFHHTHAHTHSPSPKWHDDDLCNIYDICGMKTKASTFCFPK